MPSAARLGILGSCVSRDMAHEHPDCAVEFYVARQSLLSAFSKPYPDAADLPLDLASAFQTRMVRGDLASNLVSTVREHGKRLDALVIDLVDERLGVVRLDGGGFATNSQEFKQSGIGPLVVDEGTAPLGLGDPEHLREWTRAAHLLIDLLEDLGLAQKTVVLQTAFAEFTVDGRRVPPFMGIPAATWNRQLSPYFDVFRGRGVHVRELPARLAVADAHHRWGLSPYHYPAAAYAWLWDEVRSTLALRGEAGAPSPLARVRVPVSVPVSRVTRPPRRGAARLRVDSAVEASRWRLRISNFNERTLRPGGGPVQLSGLWIAPAAPDGTFDGEAERLMPRFTVPGDGRTVVTPWVTPPAGGRSEWLVAFGWESAKEDGAVFTLADSFQWSDPGAALASDADHLPERRYVPLAWQVEADTSAPVVTAWSDERVLSPEPTRAIADSALSRLARSRAAVAVHVTYPGTSMSQWAGYSQQWAALPQPARGSEVLHIQGWHDVVNGATAHELRERFHEVLPRVQQHFGGPVAAVLIGRFRPLDASQEMVREAHNAWLLATFEGPVYELTDGDLVQVRSALPDEHIPPRHTFGDIDR